METAGAPHRRFAGGGLVIASHNPGKVAELTSLLRGAVADPVSAGALGLPEPAETGASFQENAAVKARAAALGSGAPALADDSGLVVPALGGAPGIFSARWAGPEGDFAAAMARIERALAEGADRAAGFVCALALAWPDGHCEVFEGRIAGALIWPPRGTCGFGYDPMFVPAGGTLTFGQMAPEAKDRISHRARAWSMMRAACFGGS